jgi:hypothetical protein
MRRPPGARTPSAPWTTRSRDSIPSPPVPLARLPFLPGLIALLIGFLLLVPQTFADSPNPPTERIGNAWSDPRNPIVRTFAGRRLDLWSLQPVRPVSPPRPSNSRESLAPIDLFIRASVANAQLKPAPEADARTLIRRLTFDLTGLPPHADQVEAYLVECRNEVRPGTRSSPNIPVPNAPYAYRRLVDRLLASPRYGEHQARLWLDVIRYSDSNGFDWDEFRPRAWRFRDYVIRAFNTDKPFNRFIEEQLAGDEQVSGPPKTPEEQDAWIATGYLRLGPHDNAASLFNEQDRSRAELMADLTETTGSAFLALSLSCCRCHDHKYDPLSQADHFRLRAFFEPVKFADDLPLDLAPDQEAIRTHNHDIDARISDLERERDALRDQVRDRLRNSRLAQLSPEERALLELPEADQPEDLKGRIAGLRKKVDPSDKEVRAALDPSQKETHDALEARIASFKRDRRNFTLGLLMTDRDGPPPITRILFQGDHQHERAEVQPGFPSVLDPNPAIIQPAPNPSTTGRRLALAQWISSPTNPFTARVFVNRIWQQHFGRGLVDTSNDFGLAGSRPSHPELLDWLAGDFIRHGWSVKHLHRVIVLSSTYRQHSLRTSPTDSSAPDPDNLLLSRQNPRRLSAEQLRDALLATSGLLQHRDGGPPIWPDLPPEILQANPAFLDDNETRTKGWYPSPKDQQTVRSVFLIQKRTVRVPFMETFDLPENSTSCARRTESTVAPQALSLLNSPLAIECARSLGDRLQREAGPDLSAQVHHAFRIVLQRAASTEEHQACLDLARRRSLPELCRALLNLNEFAYAD